MKRSRELLDQDDATGPSCKLPKLKGEYSTVVQRMMASMGYKAGKGLGREGDGIAEPIEDSSHKGRRGLGFSLEGLEKEVVKWEPEELNWNQKPVWLKPADKDVLSFEELKLWMKTGLRKESIAEETHFCNPKVLNSILRAKSVFDSLTTKEFLDARQRSNPFETIKGAIFQNRAAMKMANIDAAFDWMFTNPRSVSNKPLLSADSILYFADLCAGPGGFSEYVLWKKKWNAKGFGFTLKDPEGASDFKLDQFLSAPCETFDPHYGEGGYDGDGDITKPENLKEFRDYVLDVTDGAGVHFVMADGGISVEGQENIQEILTKQLVLCQYICALSILCEGGHFVCKVFDMFTPFSVGLFYLLYHCFNKICIFKPVTSRPANSERYIVGLGLHADTYLVQNYLLQVNKRLQELKGSERDVLEVVPLEILRSDEVFFSYITNFNDSFGYNQIQNLKKIQYFVKNSSLMEVRQQEVKQKCLELWKIPNSPRTVPVERKALEYFNSLLQEFRQMSNDTTDLSVFQSRNFRNVTIDNLEFLKDFYSWKWHWACGKRYLLIGLGRNMVIGWDMMSAKPNYSSQPRKEWNNLELPRGTIIEVECCLELSGEGPGQIKRDTVYIVDVISIYDEIVGHKPFKERIQLAKKLCKAVNKPCRNKIVPLKTKSYHRIVDAPKYFSGLTKRRCKGESGDSLTVDVGEEWFIVVRGIVFLKHISDPWHLHKSSTEKLFYYNGVTKESTYSCPPSSVSPYLRMVAQRCLWLLNSEAIRDFSQNGLDFPEDGPPKQLTLAYLTKIILNG